MKVFRIVLLLSANLILIIAVLLWIPVTSSFPSHADPAQDYADAIQRFEALHAKDTPGILPECNSTLLTHGEAVTNTIVFFHGIANCPAQFAVLGQRFYESGYNVLIPRLPYHGMVDRMSTDMEALTAEQLVALADQAVDIAAGLGDQVTVAGFSTGGAMAAWLADERPEVDQTVLMSAFLSPRAYPSWFIRPLVRVLLALPNQFWWWDPELKEALPGPPHAYPRYPSHAMAEIMRLSLSVRRDAEHNPPLTGSVLVITNDGPREAVDNSVTTKLLAQWQQHGMQKVSTYQFDRSLDLDHDYVDPAAPNQPISVTEVIYPILMEQIQGFGAQK